MQTFYSSVIRSVLTFGLTSWGGNLSEEDKGRVNKLIRKAGGVHVFGKRQDSLDTLYDRRSRNKLTTILKDETHPLRPTFDSMKIDRSGRFRTEKTRTVRYGQSFVPAVAEKFNQSFKR